MCDTSRLIAVTNRALCRGDFLAQLRRVAEACPRAMILREKDLPPADYAALAETVLKLCREREVPCFLHTHTEIAAALGCRRIHLSIPALRERRGELGDFDEISVSCHSLADVEEAAAAGATQVLLGNIFETDCKKGLPGKGLDFLAEVCRLSPVPVYGIGGITPEKLPQMLSAGAAGGCMMSGFMRLGEEE
jgi:thiamine-phosphate pyrophosphorylase